MFNDNDSMNIEEIIGMIGGPINGINMTPFSIMSGTLVGVLRPNEENPGSLVILTSKDFSISDELVDLDIQLIDFIGEDKYNEVLESTERLCLDLSDDNCTIKMDLDKEILEKCKIILMPFTNMISEESIIKGQTEK